MALRRRPGADVSTRTALAAGPVLSATRGYLLARRRDLGACPTRDQMDPLRSDDSHALRTMVRAYAVIGAVASETAAGSPRFRVAQPRAADLHELEFRHRGQVQAIDAGIADPVPPSHRLLIAVRPQRWRRPSSMIAVSAIPGYRSDPGPSAAPVPSRQTDCPRSGPTSRRGSHPCPIRPRARPARRFCRVRRHGLRLVFIEEDPVVARISSFACRCSRIAHAARPGPRRR